MSPDRNVLPAARSLPVDALVAIEFNGGYVVLMATPGVLVYLAYGFARSERLIESADGICEVALHPVESRALPSIFLHADHAEAVFEQVPHQVAELSCGLCDIENLVQAPRPLPIVRATSEADPQTIFRALNAVPVSEMVNRAPGKVNAAALCAPYGEIRLVREDVDRYNAFDKLIGAMLRAGTGASQC